MMKRMNVEIVDLLLSRDFWGDQTMLAKVFLGVFLVAMVLHVVYILILATLESWCMNLRSSTSHEQVVDRLCKDLPGILFETISANPRDDHEVIFHGVVIQGYRVQSNGQKTEVALTSSEIAELNATMHKARRRVFGRWRSWILKRSIARLKIPAPSRHEMLASLARVQQRHH
jgi:hypothetical protein